MIKIIHVSDLHFGRCDDHATERGIALLSRIHATYHFESATDTYLLHTGDFINGLEVFETAKHEWGKVVQSLSGFVPDKLLCCPGNHDQNPELGTLELYHDFCEHVGVPTDCCYRRDLVNGDTKVFTLGVDSTWWAPIAGIAGVGKIDDDEMANVEAFAEENVDSWKLCYLHHRPAQHHPHQPPHTPPGFGLDLSNADAFLGKISTKVNILAFGHDQNYDFDCDGHIQPTWLNANRSKGYTQGWLDLTFDPNKCVVNVFDYDGAVVKTKEISRV